nr:hypothetical protein [Nitrosomonas nitrosa]
MDIPDLSFWLNVNCSCTDPNFYTWFHEEWVDFGIVWRWSRATSGETDDYHIEYGANPNRDSERISEDDGGYYYPDYVFVTTRHNPDPTSADLERQLQFARELIGRLRKKGCDVKFQGQREFEDLL